MSASAIEAAPPASGEVIRTALPDDFDGIRFEIARMSKYVKHSATDPFMKAVSAEICGSHVEMAGRMGLGAEVEASDPRAVAIEAIEAWCREHFVYVNDPVGIEVIQMPRRMIKQTMIPPEVILGVIAPVTDAMRESFGAKVDEYVPAGIAAGDCDELSTGMISVAAAAPVEIRPLRFRFGGNQETLHHVWGRPYIGDTGVDCDLTEPGYGLGDFSKFHTYEEVEVEL